ncbi:hypothetical protein B5K06_27290 [Rhizobium grahamii]|uniref:Uncharacterized protein n=1 Tax=Rhizobium grahamii TaxID=1120045 RepID=A0A370KH61_9HYPH|nr:hypothetical protein B5K06_27290 [Rhizobium grahamii]
MFTNTWNQWGVGGEYHEDSTQWLDERGVAAVAPAAVRPSATEKLKDHRPAVAILRRAIDARERVSMFEQKNPPTVG